MKKKIVALMIAGVMVFSVAGCGAAKTQNASNGESAAAEESAAAAEESAVDGAAEDAVAEDGAAEEAATEGGAAEEAAADENAAEEMATADSAAADSASAEANELGYKTLSDAFANEEFSHAFTDTKFIYAFEKDGSCYRVVADITPKISEALFSLDFSLEDYDEQMKALVADCAITEVSNLTENIPDQAEIDKNVGKTGEELIDDGWYVSVADADSLSYTMCFGPYEYTVTFEGEPNKSYSYDEDGYIAPMKAASITYEGIGDAAYFDW